jgi:NB-ARC domain
MQRKEPALAEEDLPSELKRALNRKRYLVILDDVWTCDLWETLKTTLPDMRNASRVIITSRNIGVARAADRNTEPHKLSYLDEKDSLILLFRKAFQHRKPEGLESQDEDSTRNKYLISGLIKYLSAFINYLNPLIKYSNIPLSKLLNHRWYHLPIHGVPDRTYSLEEYPQELIEVAKNLTRKCGRLPLALVVLGGILSRKERTYTAWRLIEQNMDWHYDEGNKCSKVLAISYENLPYHLKPCFLYFASFPEDYKISAKHLTRMWIAEGFIPDGVGTLEYRAELCLEELVQRYIHR